MDLKDAAGWCAEQVNPMKPTKWWRVSYPKGIWCETPDELEARRKLATAPEGSHLRRLYMQVRYEWRDVDGDGVHSSTT